MGGMSDAEEEIKAAARKRQRRTRLHPHARTTHERENSWCGVARPWA